MKQILGHRTFLKLWLALLVSSFGDWLAIVALFSLVAFGLRATPPQVSSMMIAFVLPAAVAGPLAGVFVDRWDLKRTMIGSDLVRVVIAALLAWAPALPHLYGLLFLLSLASCFFLPAQQACLPLLLPKESLLLANSLTTQAVQVNRVLAPAAAGFVVAWAGEKACFYIDSATFLFSAAMLSGIAIPARASGQGRGLGAVWSQLLEGWKFIAGHRAISFVMMAWPGPSSPWGRSMRCFPSTFAMCWAASRGSLAC